MKKIIVIAFIVIFINKIKILIAFGAMGMIVTLILSIFLIKVLFGTVFGKSKTSRIYDDYF